MEGEYESTGRRTSAEIKVLWRLLTTDWFTNWNHEANSATKFVDFDVFTEWLWISVTRLGNLLDFGQLFKAFGSN